MHVTTCTGHAITGTKRRRRRRGKRRGRRRKEAECARSEATTTAHDPVFGGWNVIPGLSYAGPRDAKQAGGTEKKKRSKRGKRGSKKGSLKSLRAVDTAAYLAKGVPLCSSRSLSVSICFSLV